MLPITAVFGSGQARYVDMHLETGEGWHHWIVKPSPGFTDVTGWFITIGNRSSRLRIPLSEALASGMLFEHGFAVANRCHYATFYFASESNAHYGWVCNAAQWFAVVDIRLRPYGEGDDVIPKILMSTGSNRGRLLLANSSAGGISGDGPELAAAGPDFLWIALSRGENWIMPVKAEITTMDELIAIRKPLETASSLQAYVDFDPDMLWNAPLLTPAMLGADAKDRRGNCQSTADNGVHYDSFQCRASFNGRSTIKKYRSAEIVSFHSVASARTESRHRAEYQAVGSKDCLYH